MGTIMARVRTFGSKRYWLCPAMTVLPLALVGPQAIAAESLFDASLKSAVYGYQLKTAEQSNKTDDLVWELAPTINWQRQSAAMKTRINWRHETLFYKDAQPDKRSFNEFDFNNQISFFRERLIWSLDASQAYQIRDSRLGIFSDKITGAENLSKTNRYGSGLLFRNLKSAKYRTELDLSYRNYDSAAAEVDDGLLEAGQHFFGQLTQRSPLEQQGVAAAVQGEQRLAVGAVKGHEGRHFDVDVRRNFGLQQILQQALAEHVQPQLLPSIRPGFRQGGQQGRGVQRRPLGQRHHCQARGDDGAVAVDDRAVGEGGLTQNGMVHGSVAAGNMFQLMYWNSDIF